QVNCREDRKHQMPTLQATSSNPPRSVESNIQVVNGYEIYMKNLPPTKWIIDEILPEGAALLSGDPKVGKSFLALQIAVAVSGSATTVFDSLPVRTKGRVLYLALDDGSEKRIHDR